VTARSRPAPDASEKEHSTDAVLVASRALVGVAARSLGAVEDTITLVQYRALVLLASHGEMNVGALADAFELHQSTATRLCDRLVAKGLIERAPSAQSRREVFVVLTPAGKALIRSVTARRRREIAKIMERLSRRQRAIVVDAFSTFAEAAGEAPDDAWKLGWTT
jgi:DNA-binding MarR family transcriptional regulator